MLRAGAVRSVSRQRAHLLRLPRLLVGRATAAGHAATTAWRALCALAGRRQADVTRCTYTGPLVGEAARRRVFEDVSADPLVRQLIALRRARGEYFVDQPWKAIAEQRTIAVVMASARKLVHLDNRPYGDSERGYLLSSILAAETFALSHDLTNLAADAPMPRHVIDSDLLPFRSMYLAFEAEFQTELRQHGNSAEQAEAVGLQLLGQDDGVAVVVHMERPDNAWPIAHDVHIRYGQTFPDDIRARDRSTVRWALAILSLINSHYTDTDDCTLPRAWRRRKEFAAYKEQQIRVVRLRRLATGEPNADASEDDGQRRAYRRRWIVSGHHRAQWYPSRKAHRVIWIAPHMKGQQGGDVIEKAYMVTR